MTLSRRVLTWLLIANCLLLDAGCDQRNSSPPLQEKNTSKTRSVETSSISSPQFHQMAQQLGMDHVYRNGEESNRYAYVESLGGGLATLDFDRDGWFDLFFPGGGSIPNDTALQPLPGTLWRNENGVRFLNVSEVSLVNKLGVYSHGAASGDLDNDGFPELLITGHGGLQLFWNQGDGTWIECAAEVGLTDQSWSTSAAFADLNNDGFSDLYITHYVDWRITNNPPCTSASNDRDICPPARFPGLPDLIYMSNQDRSFRRCDQNLGLAPDGKGLGVIAANLDDDKNIDLYVANDTTNNFLYRNTGMSNLQEIGLQSGTALDERGLANGSMGLAILDYDADLKPDVWVTNYENETFALYKNDGDLQFRCVTTSTGITAIGNLYVGFGTCAADFDHDGDEDIVVANGHVMRHPVSNSVDQYPLFIENNGSKRLVRKQFHADNYFSKKWRGRGVAPFDFDHDGDLDLAFSHVNQPAEILQNESLEKGNWWIFQLCGTVSNRDAIGARLIASTSKRKLMRTIIGGGSYLTQAPYLVHFALPSEETIERLEIRWPNDTVSTILSPVRNQYSLLVEPQSLPR